MNPNYKILLAFVLAIILRILCKPWVLSWSDDNYSIHKNKIYDAVLIGSFISIVLIFIDSSMLTNVQMIIWIILFISIVVICNHVIKNQVFIDENDFILKLKEDNEETIKLSSEIILNKNVDQTFKNYLIQNNKIKQQSINELDELSKNF